MEVSINVPCVSLHSEINIMWAAHQVHHSSEDYNLTTALRQSAVQHLGSWGFYLPMALGIPPSVFLVHIQLNLLYQFWIHTEVRYHVFMYNIGDFLFDVTLISGHH